MGATYPRSGTRCSSSRIADSWPCLLAKLPPPSHPPHGHLPMNMRPPVSIANPRGARSDPYSASRQAQPDRRARDGHLWRGRSLRIRRAVLGLLHSADPVSSIAMDAGFGDLSTFNHRFREAFQTNPQAYVLLRSRGGTDDSMGSALRSGANCCIQRKTSIPSLPRSCRQERTRADRARDQQATAHAAAAARADIRQDVLEGR